MNYAKRDDERKLKFPRQRFENQNARMTRDVQLKRGRGCGEEGSPRVGAVLKRAKGEERGEGRCSCEEGE